MKSPNHALNYNESTKIIAALRAMHTPNKPCVAGREPAHAAGGDHQGLRRRLGRAPLTGGGKRATAATRSP
jgi:hypothetical protein